MINQSNHAPPDLILYLLIVRLFGLAEETYSMTCTAPCLYLYADKVLLRARTSGDTESLDRLGVGSNSTGVESTLPTERQVARGGELPKIR